MVQLEEVDDPEIHPPNFGSEEDDDADFTDTDSSISSSSLPPPLDETLADRLYALRDIIPPHSRRRIHTTFSTLSSYTSTSLKWTGKGLWVLSAGMIFWGVPFAMAWSEEVAIVEQEREIRAREQAGEMVGMGSSPGVGTGVGAKPAV